MSELIRSTRLHAGISQRELAARAGTSVARISAYETGKRQPTISAANEVLQAIGQRIVLTTEPTEADLDRRIAAFAATPIRQRLARASANIMGVWHYFESEEPILEGAAAAYVQGVPVPVEVTDLVLTHDKIGAVASKLLYSGAARWNTEYQRYTRDISNDPREPGPLRWEAGYGELAITFVDELPLCSLITIPAAYPGGCETLFRAVTLDQIGALDAELARLVDRVIDRSRANTAAEAAEAAGVASLSRLPTLSYPH